MQAGEEYALSHCGHVGGVFMGRISIGFELEPKGAD